MGFKFGFGGKGFKVSVSKRGIYTRIGSSKGLSYSKYIGTGGKHKKRSSKPTGQVEYNTSDYKIVSIILTILAIPLILLGLLLSVLVFSDIKVIGYIGFIVVGFGVFMLLKAKQYRNKTKQK